MSKGASKGGLPLIQGGRYLPWLPRMGYSTRAVRMVLGTSSIPSTLYKLKLQFCRISRDRERQRSRKRRRLSRQEKRRLFRRSYRAIFQRAPGYTFNAFPRKEEEEKSRKNLPLPLGRYKRNAGPQRWNARALRADVSLSRSLFLSGECAGDLRGGSAFSSRNRRPVEIIHNNESHA